ncbi:hypothetical protein FOMA001_g18044 [Fusarium oxysporum f. sp. matthiolae]|nr:hypothetical protein FOMA001_g18044 [Fusarium oxysporum f. sp. matthiolae]
MPRDFYTESEIVEAMLDVTDNGLSQNQSAQKHGMPQTTLSDRLRCLPSKSEVTHPAQLLSKTQETRLVIWVLRQEALGYAPSHSQVRATVAALLRQQGREKPIGVHWVARFVKRHPATKAKIGKRQEASRFNSLLQWPSIGTSISAKESMDGSSPRTVTVDEGGILAGFGKDSPFFTIDLLYTYWQTVNIGLDSLVIGSSDPNKKAFLKGSQSRIWTSFIEGVTADGRLLHTWAL